MKHTLLILFFIALIGELIGIHMDSMSRWITKPLVVALILIYYVVISRMKQPLMMLALVSAMLGDLFMLLPDGAGFTLGLFVFLIMHLILISLFNKTRENAQSSQKLIIAGPTFIVGIGGAIYLVPQAGSLNIAVGLYTLAITMMAVFAVLRVKKIPGYWMVVIGAILFMLSDLLIGFTRFVAPVPMGEVAIMALYGIGLFLIVEGYVKGDDVLVQL